MIIFFSSINEEICKVDQIKKQLLILDWRQFLAGVNKAPFKVVFLNDIDAYQNLPTIVLTLEVSLLRLNTVIDHSSFNNYMGPGRLNG